MYASTLEKKISKFVRRFGIKRTFCTNYFEYRNGIIKFTILSHPLDETFIDFVNNKYNTDITSWYFIFSILHEVGHHVTLSTLSEDDLKWEYVIRTFGNLTNEEYFNLPSEDLANKWAIDYILNHQQECWDFQRKCSKIMRHIYKKKSFHY